MKNLSLVAAIGANYELGIDNHLIWHIKEDMVFYRDLTINKKNIIMGRKTLESLPPKALNKRNPFVLSTRNLEQVYEVNCFNNISSLLEYISSSEEDFIVIGGSIIYKEFMPYVDTMYLTEILEYENADTFFPYFDVRDWDVEMIGDYSNEKVPYIRNKYVRKRVK
ncbi:MAG: dihydrofolate reductase [Bacilli bacterium]|nr:dihydrofolate reductase [Bacilli bacterium]